MVKLTDDLKQRLVNVLYEFGPERVVEHLEGIHIELSEDGHERVVIEYSPVGDEYMAMDITDHVDSLEGEQ